MFLIFSDITLSEVLILPPPFSLLFATTNHIERLDPALSRPGRMDVWINFRNATKWQAEGIFKCFFPADKPSTASPLDPRDPLSQENLAMNKRKKPSLIVPPLSENEINSLASRFADAIPDEEFSVRRGVLWVPFLVSDYLLGCFSAGISLEEQDPAPRMCY